jgi:hypothetical protein
LDFFRGADVQAIVLIAMSMSGMATLRQPLHSFGLPTIQEFAIPNRRPLSIWLGIPKDNQLENDFNAG